MTTDAPNKRDVAPEASAKGGDTGLKGVDRLELLRTPPTGKDDAVRTTPEPGRDVHGQGGPTSLTLVDRDTLPVARQSAQFDPNRPTALFLDNFAAQDEKLKGKISHGDLSLKAAENRGFNVIGLEATPESGGFGDRLKEIDRRVASGELKLGKGDVINISMGNPDKTFADASKELGFEVNAQNLESMRPLVIERMRQLSNDPNQPAEVRERNRQSVDANDAIARLQARGIEVIHASGNFGQDKFSPEFLNAKTQLSANRPDGSPTQFSASHSLTTEGNGLIPTKFKNELDLLSPVPAASQVGMVEFGDTGVRVPATIADARKGNADIFNPQSFDGRFAQPLVKQAPPALDAGLLSPEATGPRTTFDTSSPVAPKGTQVERLPRFSVTINGAPSMLQRDLQPGEVAVVGVGEGTSFSNIGYLDKNFERLQQLKRGQ